MNGGPLERLRSRIAAIGTPLCLGIDPHPDALPDGLSRDVAGIEAFTRDLIEVAAPAAAAVKINVAFFEAFGAAGWAALERVRGDVPASHLVILDAKRGDIGSTAERYAAGLFGQLEADAVTLSPFLGADAIEPFLDVPDRLVYLLARTSNPSAGTFQDLRMADGERLDERVADWVEEQWPADPRVGLVVGATGAADLRRMRDRAPGRGFLVPGVGAQGGDPALAADACHGSLAPGVVNVSRGISAASGGADWRAAAAEAARSWARLLRGEGARLEA